MQAGEAEAGILPRKMLILAQHHRPSVRHSSTSPSPLSPSNDLLNLQDLPLTLIPLPLNFLLNHLHIPSNILQNKLSILLLDFNIRLVLLHLRY